MTGHTPGPWSIYEDDEEPTLVVQYETMPSYYLPIWGKIFSERPITDTDRANARLIAAAPEMLAALRRCAEGYERMQRNTTQPQIRFEPNDLIKEGELYA